ncbi:hypothetical protein BTO32_03230 [Marinobacter lutaoensis]|jgi:hypothetical protein|uniref:Uncharacterized protein n=1 Tax=Marinobacter lutaoensis TaxID=135739 RepID=A0A1V2DW98_9GAMM|nr:hypothetical protein [Marinobacter lutaoensis]ONF44769.1 hypothetical protein BTO32_03230 [Marinobacter lutaoensis]
MYQLVFKGECVPGTDVQVARNNARALFKASVEQVERMFSGQPVVLRNKLEQAQAEKYRAVLNRHGLVAYVQPMPGSEPPTRPEPVQPRPAALGAASAEPASQAPDDVPAAPEVEPGERLPVAGDKVDSILAGSHLRLDPVGVTLVEPRTVEEPMFQHLEAWSLAPAGSDLGVSRPTPPPIVPDTSHLSLVDEDTSS